MMPSEYVDLLLTLAVCWWCMCRARHMSPRTSLIDRISLLCIGIGSGAYTLLLICRLSNTLFGTNFEIDEGVVLLVGPVYRAGVAGWIIMPSVRKRMSQWKESHV